MLWKLGAFIVTITTFNAFADATLVKNDREGKSYYSKLFTKKSYTNFEASTDLQAIEGAWAETSRTLSESSCASSVFLDFKKNYKKITSAHFEGENSFLYLRKNNYIDDVTFKIFQKISDVDVIDLANAEFKPQKENSLSKFLARAKTKGFCAEVQFANYVSEINPDKKKVKERKIRSILRSEASELGLDQNSRRFLEGLLANEFYGSQLNLSDYIAKRKILRGQYPLPLENEFSDFITIEPDKANNSLRIELYRKYSYVQIALMGKVITDLRTQLESDRIEILVYERDTDEVAQTILLEPMERFRFAISYLRKQMDELTRNTFFKGLRPSYEEIVAASFELGLVTASEWDEVRGLEDIWNPEKTFWDKALMWGRTILPVASVLIPPPYGFISTLAIVAIDAVTMKNKQNSQMTHSLFK